MSFTAVVRDVGFLGGEKGKGMREEGLTGGGKEKVVWKGLGGKAEIE